MDQHELFGAATYIHVGLSVTRKVGRGLSPSRDRRSIVVVGQCRWRLDKKIQVAPLDQKATKNTYKYMLRFFPTATVQKCLQQKKNLKTKLLGTFSFNIALPIATVLRGLATWGYVLSLAYIFCQSWLLDKGIDLSKCGDSENRMLSQPHQASSLQPLTSGFSAFDLSRLLPLIRLCSSSVISRYALPWSPVSCKSKTITTSTTSTRAAAVKWVGP